MCDAVERCGSMLPRLREGHGVAPEVRGRGFLWLGRISAARGDHGQASALLQEALTVLRRVGDSEGTARVLSMLGVVVHRRGRYERAAALWEQALPERLGLSGIVGYALQGLSEVAVKQGQLAEARERLRESLLLGRDLATGRIHDRHCAGSDI